jgi:hypothetical protein
MQLADEDEVARLIEAIRRERERAATDQRHEQRETDKADRRPEVPSRPVRES